MSERKVATVKGMVIAEVVESGQVIQWNVYTADEWAYGKGMRYPDMECDTLESAKEFARSY